MGEETHFRALWSWDLELPIEQPSDFVVLVAVHVAQNDIIYETTSGSKVSDVGLPFPPFVVGAALYFTLRIR